MFGKFNVKFHFIDDNNHINLHIGTVFSSSSVVELKLNYIIDLVVLNTQSTIRLSA